MRDLARYNLHRAGFHVLTAADGAEGLEITRKSRPDIIVLDLMLPRLTGQEVCRILRNDPILAHVPIIMLTAKSQPEDRIAGLELGADDYLTKPFSPRELVLRVEGLLRRITSAEPTEVFHCAGFEIDKRNFEIRLMGRKLELTHTEFKLLALLIDRRGKVLSRSVLLADVWGYHSEMDTRTVDTHMRRLREKLGDSASRIETVRGEGYRFMEADSHAV